MDLTARPQPMTFLELLGCCTKDVEDGEGDEFHNTTSQMCSISTFDKGVSSSTALDSPRTQSTIEADEDGQTFSESIREVEEEQSVTSEKSTGSSSSSSIDKEWYEQSIKAAIDNNEQNSDELKDESFDDASVIFDNLTDFAEELHQEVDTVVSNVVDALFS